MDSGFRISGRLPSVDLLELLREKHHVVPHFLVALAVGVLVEEETHHVPLDVRVENREEGIAIVGIDRRKTAVNGLDVLIGDGRLPLDDRLRRSVSRLGAGDYKVAGHDKV